MQSKFKVLQSLLILGLVFVSAWPAAAYAQEDPPIYCATLEAEDCTILTAAREEMADLHSVSSDIAFEFVMSDIPDAPFDELTMNIEQQTAYMLTEDGMAVREKLGDAELVSELLAEDPAGFLELYSGMMMGSTYDSSFRISVSEETMALIQEAIEEDSGDPIPFALPNEFGIRSKLVDGTLFTNLSEMLDPLPGIKAIGDVWFGFEYGPMMDLTMAAARADGDLDPMELEEAAMAGQFVAAVAGGGGPFVTTVAGFPYSEEMMPSLAIERLEDGAQSARFRTTVDYATLLSEPIVKELLADLIRDPDFGDMQMSDDEMTEMMAVVQLMGPTVLDSLGLEIIEEIDLETGLLLGSEFHLNWDIEALAPMINMAGGPDLSELEAMPVVTLNGTATHTDHNTEMVIETPETALIISTEEIMELIPEEELQQFLSSPEPDFEAQSEVAAEIAAAEIAAATALAAANTTAAESVPQTAEQQVAAELAAGASNAIDTGDYDAAISLFDEALLLDPENANHLMERGRAYYFADDMNAALKDADQSIAIQPNAINYNLRGAIYRQLDNNDQAIFSYDMAIAYDSTYQYAYANRGLVYSDMGLYEDAIADYTAALEIDPTYLAAYDGRASIYYEINEYELALVDYNAAIELDSQSPRLYVDRALTHYGLDQIDEEIADYTSAIGLKPDYIDAYYYRGLSYEEIGEPELAIADYSKVIELDPEDADIYWNRGYLYQSIGKADEAIADLKRYLELDPDAVDREDVEASIAELGGES